MDGHMMRIFSVLYLPNDDHVFLSGGWDDTLQVRNPTISLIIQTWSSISSKQASIAEWLAHLVFTLEVGRCEWGRFSARGSLNVTEALSWYENDLSKLVDITGSSQTHFYLSVVGQSCGFKAFCQVLHILIVLIVIVSWNLLTSMHNFQFYRRIFGPHICGDALDILPSNGNILTGSWRKDNSVQIWDFNSGELIRDVPDDFNKSMVGYVLFWRHNLAWSILYISYSTFYFYTDVLCTVVTRWSDYCRW